MRSRSDAWIRRRPWRSPFQLEKIYGLRDIRCGMSRSFSPNFFTLSTWMVSKTGMPSFPRARARVMASEAPQL